MEVGKKKDREKLVEAGARHQLSSDSLENFAALSGYLCFLWPNPQHRHKWIGQKISEPFLSSNLCFCFVCLNWFWQAYKTVPASLCFLYGQFIPSFTTVSEIKFTLLFIKLGLQMLKQRTSNYCFERGQKELVLMSFHFPALLKNNTNTRSSLCDWNSLNNFCWFCVNNSKLYQELCVSEKVCDLKRSLSGTENVVMFKQRMLQCSALVLLTFRKRATENDRRSLSVSSSVWTNPSVLYVCVQI